MPEENPDPVMLLSPDGRILYGNPAAAELFRLWNRAGGDRVPSEVREIVSAVGAGRAAERLEMTFGAKTYALVVKPVDDYVAVYARDITGRFKAEQALRRSEERYHRLFDEDLTGNLITEPEGRILLCNSAFAGIFGFSSAREAVGTNITDLYLDPAERRPLVEELKREGKLERLEVWRKRRNGEHVYIVENLVAWFDDRGEVSEVMAHLYDHTDRKRAGEQLREASRRNERIAAQWNSVLNQMTEGLVVFDPEGNLLDMNPAALSIHGFDTVERLRLDLTQLGELFELWDLEGRPLSLDQWPIGRVLRGETFQSYEVRVRRRDTGRTWFASYGGTPVYDSQGKLILSIVTLRDITARKDAESRLKELTGTLEARVARRTSELERRARQLQNLSLELSQAEDRERRRLAEILHDDLQQQLAAVKFYAGRIISRSRGDPVLQEAATAIDGMLKDAIEKSRDLSYELSPPILSGAFGEAIEWLAGETTRKYGLRVRTDIDRAVRVSSEVLKSFLYRAVQELLFNIFKHAGTEEAYVRLRRRGSCVYLSVSDRGRGFDLQELETAPGFGLLGIRERIQFLGGRMRIRSGEGRGSRFFILVPDRDGEK